MDASNFDLQEMRRRAQARIDWDGGSALPKDVPPEVIVAMIDELQEDSPKTGAVEKLLQYLKSPEVQKMGSYHIGDDETTTEFLEALAKGVISLLEEKPPKDEHKLLAWIIEHNAHGESYTTPVWLPEGDKPETKELWVRAPWLDGRMPSDGR